MESGGTWEESQEKLGMGTWLRTRAKKRCMEKSPICCCSVWQILRVLGSSSLFLHPWGC